MQPYSVCLGANEQFSMKLHVMLECAEQAGLSHVVTWLPSGRAFKIFKPDIFMSHVARHFFKATKLTSIHRQLHIWGFKRWAQSIILFTLYTLLMNTDASYCSVLNLNILDICFYFSSRRVTYGNGMDAWYHTSFVQGRPEDTKKMVRTKIKKKSLSNANANANNKPKLDLTNYFQSKPLQHATYVSILDDEFERMVTGNRNQQNHNYPVIPTTKSTRRVTHDAPLSQYSDTSTLQAPLTRHNQYCRDQVSNTFTKQACLTAEPLPFRINNDMGHCNDDEFSQFINQMIQDLGEWSVGKSLGKFCVDHTWSWSINVFRNTVNIVHMNIRLLF